MQREIEYSKYFLREYFIDCFKNNFLSRSEVTTKTTLIYPSIVMFVFLLFYVQGLHDLCNGWKSCFFFFSFSFYLWPTLLKRLTILLGDCTIYAYQCLRNSNISISQVFEYIGVHLFHKFYFIPLRKLIWVENTFYFVLKWSLNIQLKCHFEK